MRRDETELGKMAPKSIDRFISLTDQLLAGAKQHGMGLGLCRFQRDKTHVDLLQPFDYQRCGKEPSIIFGGLQCSKAVSSTNP